jgi:hypothetical protein
MKTNDIIDETPMVIDESEAELSTADHQYWNSNALIENRMFLDENIFNLKKISPSFDTLYYIGLIISAMKVGSNHCSDYNLPLYQTSKNTKGEFAKSLKSVFEGNLISKRNSQLPLYLSCRYGQFANSIDRQFSI